MAGDADEHLTLLAVQQSSTHMKQDPHAHKLRDLVLLLDCAAGRYARAVWCVSYVPVTATGNR